MPPCRSAPTFVFACRVLENQRHVPAGALRVGAMPIFFRIRYGESSGQSPSSHGKPAAVPQGEDGRPSRVKGWAGGRLVMRGASNDPLDGTEYLARFLAGRPRS